MADSWQRSPPRPPHQRWWFASGSTASWRRHHVLCRDGQRRVPARPPHGASSSFSSRGRALADVSEQDSQMSEGAAPTCFVSYAGAGSCELRVPNPKVDARSRGVSVTAIPTSAATSCVSATVIDPEMIRQVLVMHGDGVHLLHVLPGPYDALAVTLSVVARLFGMAGARSCWLHCAGVRPTARDRELRR
jgi:hypothetical protein